MIKPFMNLLQATALAHITAFFLIALNEFKPWVFLIYVLANIALYLACDGTYIVKRPSKGRFVAFSFLAPINYGFGLAGFVEGLNRILLISIGTTAMVVLMAATIDSFTKRSVPKANKLLWFYRLTVFYPVGTIYWFLRRRSFPRFPRA